MPIFYVIRSIKHINVNYAGVVPLPAFPDWLSLATANSMGLVFSKHRAICEKLCDKSRM